MEGDEENIDSPYQTERFEMSVNPMLAEIEEMVDQLMSPDSQTRKNGEFMWKVFSFKNVGIFLILAYCDSTLPEHVQDYCLILLKKYYSELDNQSDEVKEQRLAEADFLFDDFLNFSLEVPLLYSRPLMQLVSLIVRLNKAKCHTYVDAIFSKLNSRQTDIVCVFKQIKQIIKDSDVNRDGLFLTTISVHIESILMAITDQATTSRQKACASSCIKAFLKKIFARTHINPGTIEQFNKNCQQCYSYIVNGFVLYSDPDATNFLKKLISIIMIFVNCNLANTFRETKLIEKIWQAIQNLHLIDQYTIGCSPNKAIRDNQKLIGATLNLTLNLYTSNCTPLEINFISKIVVASLQFMRIQENFVSKNSNYEETQSDDHQEDFSELFHVRYDLDEINIHPLRPIYVKFFDSQYQHHYIELLMCIFPKLIQTLEASANIEFSLEDITWKTPEVCLWLLYKTSLIYFSLPATDCGETYYRCLYLTKFYIEKKGNPILFWHALLSNIVLCFIKPNCFSNEIIDKVYKIMLKPNQKLFQIIFASTAITRMSGLIKFQASTLLHYQSLIKHFCNCIVKQFDNDDIEDHLKEFFLRTLNIILLIDRTYLIKNLEPFFKFLFHLIKEYHQDFSITQTLVEIFNNIASYAALGEAFVSKIYPHIITALKHEYSSESFASNLSLCEIVKTILILSKNQLTYEQVNSLYNMIFKLLEVDDNQILYAVTKITCVCVDFYGNNFKISENLDGSFNSCLITTIIFKYLDNGEIHKDACLLELLHLSFSKIPFFSTTPYFSKIIFKICFILQDSDTKFEDKEFYLILVMCFFNNITKSTIELSAKLIGLYFDWAFTSIFRTWYVLHKQCLFSYNFFKRYSIFTLTNIFKYCIDNKHPVLEKIPISVYKNNTTELITIPVCRAIAAILLNEYHLMNQTISHDIKIPYILNFKYWLNIQSQLQDIYLMEKMHVIFVVLPSKFYKDLKPIIPKILYHYVDRFSNK